jgi:oxaloacetate decarboxylase gamma subunit
MRDGMTIAVMLGQSGVLTLLGMGIVVGFLAILIIAVTVMGKLIHALGMDKDPGAPVSARAAAPAGGGKAEGGAVTAAISAAVHEYRGTNS